MTAESKAFFSYSRLDAEFALKLAKDLRNGGASVWIDQLDISPGDHWDIAIQKAVGGSSSLLVVLSPHSVESENVMDEVSYAIEEKKLVIPVLYRKCDIPLRLRRVQYIDVSADYEAGLQKILSQLYAHQQAAKGSGAQTDRATTAEWDTAQARAASQAREREEAQVRAAQERVARENADRSAQQQRTQQEPPPNRPAPPPPAVPFSAPPAQPASNKNKIIWVAVAGVICLLLVIVMISTWSRRSASPRVTSSSLPNTSASSEPVGRKSVSPHGEIPANGAARPDLHQWLLGLITASQGPSVDALRPYFDETVSPYYSMASAGWSDIAADKQRYFNRWPEIHYQLLRWRNTPQPDGSEEIECDVSYQEVNNDGVTARGVTQYWATVRFKDGQWKITGIH